VSTSRRVLEKEKTDKTGLIHLRLSISPIPLGYGLWS